MNYPLNQIFNTLRSDRTKVRRKKTVQIDNIFNILLSDIPLAESQKSTSLDLNIQSFKACYPQARHRLFDNDQLRSYLQQHFDKNVLDAYDRLIPFAYKADLARYCILYIEGGIYSDVSHLHLNPIQVGKSASLVVFRDVAFIHPPQAVSNAVIYAEAGQSILYELIHQIVEHVNQRYYGNHPLDPTGPYLLGRKLASLEDYRGIIFGDSTSSIVGTAPNEAKQHIIKYMPNGELIAYRNKRNNASVDEFIKGGNSYAAHWERSHIYND